MGYIHDWKMKHLLKKQKRTADRMRMAQQEATVKTAIMKEEKIISQSRAVGVDPKRAAFKKKLLKGMAGIGKDIGKSMAKTGKSKPFYTPPPAFNYSGYSTDKKKKRY